MQKQKNNLWVSGLGACLLVLGFSGFGNAKNVAVQGSARVSYVSGSVNVKKSQLVSAGYRLKTGSNGRIELAFANGHRLRVGPQSNVLLVAYQPQKSRTLVKVDKGKVWNRVKPGNRVVVKGRHSTAAVLGTAYGIEVTDQATQTAVFNGSVGIHRPEDKADEQLMDSLPPMNTPEAVQTNHTGAFQAPVEIPPPMKAIPGPVEVSMEQWLEIVKNQQITMQDGGKATIQEFDPVKMTQQNEWFRWNQQMDKEFK